MKPRSTGTQRDRFPDLTSLSRAAERAYILQIAVYTQDLR